MSSATNIPQHIHVLAKPTGSRCNLACDYCFFLKKGRLYPDSHFRMNDEVLESYISQLIEAQHNLNVSVAWQGGEPTLMGLDFFRKAIALQEKYRKPGMTFENTIQTNGTLLNDDWCEFFREHHYLVGISLDGPRELHDTHRVDKAGGPTFDRVMAGIRLLQKHGVEYNVLVTVNRTNGAHPLEVYRFLRDEVKTSWIQFIPAIERLNQNGEITLYQQGSTVSERTVTAEQWGHFLITIFDEWVRKDVGKIFVQTFEAMVRAWMKFPSSGMCIFDPVCGHGLAIEHNGDLYSCDHFVEPDYLLGNIQQTPMAEMAGSKQQRTFGLNKAETLPRYCRECEVLFACHGECPRNRFIATPDGEVGLNYLCVGYKAFFNHIDWSIEVLSQLIKQGVDAKNVMQVMQREDAKKDAKMAQVGRNAPCPCGSGLKFKKCHARQQSLFNILR